MAAHGSSLVQDNKCPSDADSNDDDNVDTNDVIPRADVEDEPAAVPLTAARCVSS